MMMDEMEPGESIRLQLSGSNNRASTVWSAFSSKKTPDMYVSPRMMGGDVKISLHASGSFHTGITCEGAARLNETALRHWDIWKRGSEIGPGLTRAWYLLIPDIELQTRLVDPKARRLPSVGPDHAVSVEFLLATDDGPSLQFDDALVVARFNLAGRNESCLVLARRIAWSRDMRQLADIARDEALATIRSGGSEVGDNHTFYMHGRNSDDTRFGIELSAAIS